MKDKMNMNFTQPFRIYTWEYLLLFETSSDKASSRIWTLINDNSKESSPNISVDKTWNNIFPKLLTGVQKKLNEIAGFKMLRWSE